MSRTAMSRTAVLYAAAASTLVGAFLLVVPHQPFPHQALVPLDVPLEKMPPAVLNPAAPVTHVSVGDGVLQVDAKIDRGQLLATAVGEPVWMDVTIEAIARSERAPLSLVLVIDRSGSMAGDKIDHARLAAKRLINALGNGDELAVISYGTDVSVDLPLAKLGTAKLGTQARVRALKVIERIEEGGGTNIDGAFRATKRLLRDHASGGQAFDDRVARVILISDGRATEGERRTSRLAKHAADLRAQNVGVSTLGVGLDYHEDLMEQMATLGGGRYHYLKRSNMLGAIVGDELKHASQIVARNVTLSLPLELSGLRVGAAPGQVINTNSLSTIQLGDLASGEVRKVLLRLDRTPALLAFLQAGSIKLESPTATYRKVGTAATSTLQNQRDQFVLRAATATSEVEQSRRDDVQARVLEVQTSVKLTEAMALYSKSDLNSAVDKLSQNVAALRNLASKTQNKRLQAEAETLDRVMQEMRKAAPSSSIGADLVKAQKARAYAQRR